MWKKFYRIFTSNRTLRLLHTSSLTKIFDSFANSVEYPRFGENMLQMGSFIYWIKLYRTSLTENCRDRCAILVKLLKLGSCVHCFVNLYRILCQWCGHSPPPPAANSKISIKLYPGNLRGVFTIKPEKWNKKKTVQVTDFIFLGLINIAAADL